MFRSVVLGAALTILALAPATRAQGSDEAWKNLVAQGLASASSNDYAAAEQKLQQALREAERFGPDDARVGTTLNNLGLVYRARRNTPTRKPHTAALRPFSKRSMAATASMWRMWASTSRT